MSASSVRVLLVDDQPLLRHSLATIVDNEPDLTVIGEAGDGAEAITVARASAPDIILMDVRMPRLDGLAATRRICADPTFAGTRILVLSMFELDEYVYEALRAGASGFLLKDTRPEVLLDALRRTHRGESLFAPRRVAVRTAASRCSHRGESLFAPSILTRLVAHYVSTPRPERPTPSVRRLTAREVEVLTLIGRGLANDEIATALAISVKTVKTHISHLLAKLGARDRAQLVIAAFNAGLVRPTMPRQHHRRPG